MVLPGYYALGEPKCDLAGSALSRVARMDSILSEVDSEVSAHSADCRSIWIGRSDHLAAGCDHAWAFPDRGKHWTRGGESNQGWKEVASGVLCVVLFEAASSWRLEGHGY